MPLQYGHLYSILTTSDRLSAILTPFVKETGEGDSKVALIDFELLGKDPKASLLVNRLIGNFMTVSEEIKRTDIGTMIDFDLEMPEESPETGAVETQQAGAPPEGDATTPEEAAENAAASLVANGGDEDIDNLLEDGPGSRP
jgi:hypothetical protein